jgi:glutathione S-transferase
LLKLIFGEIPKRTPALVRPVARAISAKVGATLIEPQIKAHLDFWEAELGRSDWFAGDHFTGADVMMSFPLEAAATRADLSARPNVRGFLHRIHARAGLPGGAGSGAAPTPTPEPSGFVGSRQCRGGMRPSSVFACP